MPLLSRWFVRLSLAYLALGITLGALLLAEKGVNYAPALWQALPIHMEFLLLGWLVQLALGVAFWILPRFGQGAPRGREGPVWLSLALLNLGIGLAVLSSLAPAPWALLAGRVCEGAAVATFVVAVWKRVRPFVEG